jgi:predicted lipoprotein with Yx(FWY)xxD motif
MPPHLDLARPRRRSTVIAMVLALAAGLAVAAVAGIAFAKTFTLKMARNVHVTNKPTAAFRIKPVNKHEAVAVGPSGFAVYTFQGETTHHIICKKTNSQATNCWGFWPPVSVKPGKHISKPSTIHGRLGSFRNHGLRQLTLNGQPLYYFLPDIQSQNKRQATGDELKTFGSIWHVVRAFPPPGSASNPSTSSSTTTMPTTTTNPYPVY